jgi:hypothetical protein
MTGDEFNEWAANHFASFPETQRWLSGTESPQATLQVWRKVLLETSVAAAIEVSNRMARGDIDPLPAYERERTAAVVRREAAKIKFHIENRRQNQQYREPRFSCPQCQDSGCVTVWADRSIKYAKEHGSPPQGRYVEAVACTCARGSSFATERKEGSSNWTAMPRYDEAFHCIVRTGSPGKREVAELLDWIVGSDAAGRHTHFDEWNAGVTQP